MADAKKDGEIPNQTEGQTETPAAAPVKEMKSISLTGFGGIKMVKQTKLPEAQPNEGEILIRVKACGINFTDLMVRQGAIDNPPKTPFVMGFECAGDVEALGPNVDRFSPGDRVIAFTDYKGWAELVAVSAQYVYKIPDKISYQDGAAFLMNYVTAYIMLFDIAGLRKGHSILVHSVGGGVGHAVCQMSKLVEDVTVFGTASANKHEAIKNNLNHLFDHSADYCLEVKKISPDGVDIVLDSLCGEDTNKGIGLLKALGTYILYGSSNIVTGETKSFFSFAKSWWQLDKINPVKLFDENKTISGFNLRQLLFKQNRHEYVRDIVNKLIQWYIEGKIHPIVDSCWAFEDVGEAMQKMHDRKNIGKIMLDPAMQPKVAEPVANAENSDEKKEASG